jgi:hypothetical protein
MMKGMKTVGIRVLSRWQPVGSSGSNKVPGHPDIPAKEPVESRLTPPSESSSRRARAGAANKARTRGA